MTEENRRHNARLEAARGDDALRAAEQLLAIELPNDAISRAYYAAFHYARALLLTEGLEPRTHRGVVALLEECFVPSGRLDREMVSRLARLQTFRGLADYDARQRLSMERAAEEVAVARRFVEESRSLLRAGKWIE